MMPELAQSRIGLEHEAQKEHISQAQKRRVLEVRIRMLYLLCTALTAYDTDQSRTSATTTTATTGASQIDGPLGHTYRPYVRR